MGREWQPGDVLIGRVAPALVDDVFYVVEVTANSRAAWNEGLHAINADGNGYAVKIIRNARPLVVIDPEDREQVERLVNLVDDSFNDVHVDGPSPTAVDLAQVRLREFADPREPKPEEPLGLGAVVEDDRGRLWVRVDTAKFAWRPQGMGTDYDDNLYWSGIHAVRVLSAGYVAEEES